MGVLMVEDLVAGPRGRRLCLEFVRQQWLPETASTEDLGHALFWAEYHIKKKRGAAVTLYGPGMEGPHPSVGEVAQLLGAAPLPPVDEFSLVRAMADSIAWAYYWQEPSGVDVLLAHPAVTKPLARIASHILDSGLATWWDDGIATQQWVVDFHEDHEAPAFVSTAAETLERWHREKEASEQRARRDRGKPISRLVSGEWWSTPSPLVSTTRIVDGLGPLGLWTVEDDFGWDAATVRPASCSSDARVYEIADAAAWARLCREYPLELSAAYRRDWYETTGRDGRWLVPDWRAVAQDFHAVHVTVAGYLKLAGTPIPVDADTASVIAGWGPDRTYWLTELPQDDTRAQEWVQEGDPEKWRPTDAE